LVSWHRITLIQGAFFVAGYRMANQSSVEWAFGGYHAIQGNRRRNRLLALDALAVVTETASLEALARGQ